MDKKNISVSIVIPNYNGRNLLIETIESAKNALKTSQIKDYEIIVSDDASTDDSLKIISKTFLDIKIIQHDTNTGFAGNINRGIKSATKELVLLLNSDVHLSKNYFVSQIDYFENDQTFGVMGLIKDKQTNENQDGAKYPEVHFFNIKSNRNIYKNKTIPTLFLSGANALIRREYLVKAGGFCELFNPYYAEDVELGIRAWRMGWDLYFEPRAICFHDQSSTIKKIPNNRVRMVAKRNKYILHALHLPKWLFCIYTVTISFNAFFLLAFGKKTHFASLVLYYKSIPKIFNERKKLFSFVQPKFTLFQVARKIKKMLTESINTPPVN